MAQILDQSQSALLDESSDALLDGLAAYDTSGDLAVDSPSNVRYVAESEQAVRVVSLVG